MDVIQYNGQNVYTHSTRGTTEIHLRGAHIEIGKIVDAYIFQLERDGGGMRKDRRADFDKTEVAEERMGLMVDVESNGAQAGVAIAGLDRITQFLCDTQTLGKDLSVLKGRKVTAYYNPVGMGNRLLGIGIDN